nr:PadR family transcriptional regulator [uncultured Cohaesibacter sp.]
MITEEFSPSGRRQGRRRDCDASGPHGHQFPEQAMMLRGRGHKGRGTDGWPEGFAASGDPSGRGGFMGGRGAGRGGHSGGRGFGNGGGGRRRGRFLNHGDIRLLALALIEHEPRHGYDIIKEVEALTDSFYAPSPGVIYPTLTYLEEAGYCAVESDGNKKRYAITPEGLTFLDEHRAEANRIIEKLKALVARAKQEDPSHGANATSLPLSVETALLNLRETAAQKLKDDPSASMTIVQKLLTVAEEL